MSSPFPSKSGVVKEKLSHNILNIAYPYKILLISVVVVYFLCFTFYYANFKHLIMDSNSSHNSGIEEAILEPNMSTTTSNNTEYSSTNISHLLFALMGSEAAWHHRKGYGEAWWRPNATRGFIYLDVPPSGDLLPWSDASPPYRISENIEKLVQDIQPAVPFVIRLVHTIKEVLREGDEEGFRWLVLGDDDTVFFVDNLVNVLSHYDHTDYYYIGCQSDYIKSNFWFSFNMGFGGAGIILSYPLAEALAGDMESCLKRYAYRNTFDIITMSCIADLGVDLSQQKGLHQVDMYGDISGFLSAHPKTPLLSLHHFDEVDPVFPFVDRTEAVRHLMKGANADQSRMLQQTICYHRQHRWSVSVSWGYSVNLYETIMPRSWLQTAIETFRKWVGPNPDPPHFMFNTRVKQNDPCETPHVFFFESVQKLSNDSVILTSYYRAWPRNLPQCFGALPADYVSHVHVYSPSSARTKTSKCECCDISYDIGAKNTVVKFRECKPDEILA
ncbi:OLC1v1005422C1 [Oldenlandia corymbosa var. corymbosa]|uniref:OLC1v1005422C1 n=1 Tax=Oldenlandia corymbosa var. corymbosa TaxID=529605 RepID=A0AAV1DGK3_OLDCO|nr:OLC1v1005422C1 [Oldenlandia corymbosa var. corymbosa]